MLDFAHEHVHSEELTNVVLIKNAPDRLTLHEGTIDTVLIVSSLHEFSDPLPMLSHIKRVLKPGGQLGVVEWRHEETPEGPPLDHRLEPGTIREWFQATGFDSITTEEWTSGGYDLYVTSNPTD